MLERHDPETMRCEIGGERHYVVDGSPPYVSVTTVLAATSGMESSWAFRRWRDGLEAIEPGLADTVRDVAAARGTKLHAEATEAIVNREAPSPEDSDVWLLSMLPLLRQWSAVATLELADGAVWHGFDRVAGTLDLLLRIAGGLWLWDLKTAAKPYGQDRIDEKAAQLGAYAECLRWTYDVDVAGCGFAIALPDRPAQVAIVNTRRAVESWHGRRTQYREQQQ